MTTTGTEKMLDALWINGPRRCDWRMTTVRADCLEDLQALVGGLIADVPCPPGLIAYCHDEGLFRYAPSVRVVQGSRSPTPLPIHGPLVLFRSDPSGHSEASFTPDLLPLVEAAFIPVEAGSR